MSLILFKRYFILCVSYLFSALVPFIVVPHFIRVTSESVYGEIAILQTILTYFNLMIDFNFNLEGIRRIKEGSINKSRVVAEVISKKFQLFLFLLPLYALICFIFISNISQSLLITAYLIPLSTVFNPLWYFQAIENFNYQASLIVLSKILFILLIYYLIDSSGLAFFYNVFWSLTLLLPSLIFWQCKSFRFSYIPLGIKEFLEGFRYCSSNLAINFYTSFQLIAIGLYLPAKSVAVYAIVDRVIMGIRGFLTLFSIVVYPRMCSPDFNRKQTFIIVLLLNLMTLLIGFLLYFTGDILSMFFLRRIVEEVVVLMKILAFVPFVVSLNIYPYQYLLSRGKYSDTQRVLLIASFLGVVSFLYFSWKESLTALAWLTLIIETGVTFFLVVTFLKLRKDEKCMI